ncbi:MAG: polyribonucleotide nucleotidyltransferase [Leptospiraceae bacterium]|nr:polyribonucleotide nucleotidyltransferase [Leptospiraceae bacterium]
MQHEFKVIKETTDLKGESYELETGKWARQADGSVVLRWGDMVLLANATGAKNAVEGLDFFPLTVEYREKFYAAGKFPGGFIKREGRPTDKEILTSRLIDRPIRPLFPDNFTNEVQVFVTLLSARKNYSADVHAITAASAALSISGLPFDGPVAGVRVARVAGKFILFPSRDEIHASDINLALAGTAKAVTMIEGSADEASEEDMLAAIQFGHKEIQRLCALQEKLRAAAGKPRMAVPEKPDHSALIQKIREMGYADMKTANAVKGKHERQAAVDAVKAALLEKFQPELAALPAEEATKQQKLLKALIDELEVDVVREQIFHEGIRPDGRRLDELRPISIEVGVLPGTHGSALFTRGETQSLGVLTLGTELHVQETDDVEGESSSRFYLHYNFPPFSVGEVRRYTGPGRREIGHGKLAENSLSAVIPDAERFPYVMRLVSEILESNGSSSMASVCSCALALMDGGVPIKAPVAGVAMGLITNGEQFAVLTDIAGLEDHFGDMDFKIAGTAKGITGFQLDTKVQGISYEIMEKAMQQAKKGRLEILAEMAKVLDRPRPQLRDNAPRISTLTIERDRIGELIGPGGKNIRMIIEKTGVEINVDDSGVVQIAAADAEAARRARAMIEGQFAEAEIGKTYEGTVRKITDFGAFIEILPGRDGLCHISKVSNQRIANVADVLKEGQKVKVKVLAIDRQGKISLSIRDAD